MDEYGIGASNKFLLLISLLGFGAIAFAIYFILPPKTPKIAREIEEPQNLNRAQRRALTRQRQRQPTVNGEVNVHVGNVEDIRRENVVVNDEGNVDLDVANDEMENVARIDGNVDDDEGNEALPRMTKKEKMKAAKRAEREQRRQAELHRRDELRQRKEAEEAEYLNRMEMKRETKEKLKEVEEIAQKLKEEKETKEYEKWKATFVEHGFYTEEVVDSEREEENWNDFIEYIKKEKVVYLDVLGEKFDLTSEEVTNRLDKLEESGKLMGIRDGWGKFINITRDEMDAVANFIQSKGTVTLKELAAESSNLISF